MERVGIVIRVLGTQILWGIVVVTSMGIVGVVRRIVERGVGRGMGRVSREKFMMID